MVKDSLGLLEVAGLLGAITASVGLVLMPNAGIFTAIAPALFVGAGMLMIMDASFNIAMEPFRALVGDNLRSDQRTLGFSIQTALIGIGAIFLIIPGFATDFLGFLIIFPPTRKLIFKKFSVKNKNESVKDKDFIEGEYKDLDDK